MALGPLLLKLCSNRYDLELHALVPKQDDLNASPKLQSLLSENPENTLVSHESEIMDEL